MEYQTPTDDVIINDSTSDVIANDANESGASSPSAQADVNTEVDETGVSYKNRFLEVNRKLENLNKSIPQMIQEAAQLAAQNTQAQVSKKEEYSLNDYLTAKARDPQNAAYYDGKILDLQKQEIASTVQTQLTQYQLKQQHDAARQQAEAWAVNNFPQLNDPNSPYAQQVWATFNSRPADKREPYDFAVAAELVAARMGIKAASASNPAQEALQRKERELKKLTKERVVEGDGRGRTIAPTSTQRQADLTAALDRGNVKGYIEKYLLKPKAAEE
jgi:hypothetical protein